MSKNLPDLFDGCYDGEHRKLLAPDQFTQMFCGVCMNVGCRNSKGAGTKWNQRMLTQEDRLLNNPDFAPESTATVMGLPDFKDMIHDALKIEISTQRGDWEPVTSDDVGRAAAEMLGVVSPTSPVGFKPEPETLTCGHPLEADPAHNDPNPYATHYCMVCQALAEALEKKAEAEVNNDPADPTTVTPEQKSKPDNNQAPEGVWRVRGDTSDENGKPRTYSVTLHAGGVWDCTCPSREAPCKHTRYIQGRMAPEPQPAPQPDPIRPQPAPRRAPLPSAMNTTQPQGGVMLGGGTPPPKPETTDPWAAPTGPKMRKIGVGGRVTFGQSKKKGE